MVARTAARLDLGGFERMAAGLRKLETWVAVAPAILDWGGIELAASGLCKLETWAAAAATWRLGFGGLEQAGARLRKV